MESPVRIFPKRNEETGEVYHVRVELVFGGIKRYEVFLRKPRRGEKLRYGRHLGGLHKFNEQFYGEIGNTVSRENGIDISLYIKQMIGQTWAIIREGEKKALEPHA